MKILITFFICILPLFAQNIEITAENFEGDEKEGYSVFTGNVNVINAGNELNASKVTVFFDSDKNAKRYEAVGEVSFYIDQEQSNYKGDCGRLVYFPRQSRYEFYEAVQLYDITNDRFISGREVHVDTVSGQARVAGSKDAPAKFIFETKENNATDNN